MLHGGESLGDGREPLVTGFKLGQLPFEVVDDLVPALLLLLHAPEAPVVAPGC